MGLVKVKISVEEEDVATLMKMINQTKLKHSATVVVEFNPPISVKKL